MGWGSTPNVEPTKPSARTAPKTGVTSPGMAEGGSGLRANSAPTARAPSDTASAARKYRPRYQNGSMRAFQRRAGRSAGKRKTAAMASVVRRMVIPMRRRRATATTDPARARATTTFRCDATYGAKPPAGSACRSHGSRFFTYSLVRS